MGMAFMGAYAHATPSVQFRVSLRCSAYCYQNLLVHPVSVYVATQHMFRGRRVEAVFSYLRNLDVLMMIMMYNENTWSHMARRPYMYVTFFKPSV